MPPGPKTSRPETTARQTESVVESEHERARDYPWLDPDDDDFNDGSDLDELDPDDPHWDAFLADDDELDPQPAPNDFWPTDD